MSVTASQITSLTIVNSTVYSGTDQRKHQSSTSQAFVRGIHWWPGNSLHKWPVTRKKFPLDDIIIKPFIHENASENIVCEIVAILSKGRWVKARHLTHWALVMPSVAYRYRKSISIIELFVSIISIYIEFLATNF